MDPALVSGASFIWDMISIRRLEYPISPYTANSNMDRGINTYFLVLYLKNTLAIIKRKLSDSASGSAGGGADSTSPGIRARRSSGGGGGFFPVGSQEDIAEQQEAAKRAE